MTRLLELLVGLAGLAFVLAGTLWFLLRALRRSDDPRALALKWVASATLLGLLLFVFARLAGGAGGGPLGAYGLAFFLGSLLGAVGIVLGLMWAPHLADLVARSLTDVFDGGVADGKPPPLYSMAEARRKRGRYPEAIAEIQRQLQRHPEDCRLWLMLAEIHAEDLHDLAAATDAIETFVGQPGHAPKNVAFALNRLAEWHVKLAQDPDAARALLERIVVAFPGSTEAYAAQQRLAHLRDRPSLLAALDPKPLPVPESDPHFGLTHGRRIVAPPEPDPARVAADLVRHLEASPHDNEAREQLAVVYAQGFGRLDLATDQVEQLLAQPGVPPREVTRWLNLLTDLHLQAGHNLPAAEAALRRIATLFPGSAAAETAARRLRHLPLEAKRNEKSQTVKLGSYEQRLGLKRRE